MSKFTSGGLNSENERRLVVGLGMGDKVLYDYPLTPDSVVLEVGGHKGNWTDELINRLGFEPNIYLFEPVWQFYEEAEKRLASRKKMRLYNVGLSDKNEFATLKLMDVGTGLYAEGPEVEVNFRDVVDTFEVLKLEEVDLCVINAEGAEFTLIPRLIESGLIKRIKTLLVQFHCVVENCEEKHEAINARLRETHKIVHDYPFVWESWERI